MPGFKLAKFPFMDHNICSLKTILEFCIDAYLFLQSFQLDNRVPHDKGDNNHPVVAIHCKAGKGRTGLMIICLLIFMELKDDPDDAMAYYSKRRTSNAKGVTIPS